LPGDTFNLRLTALGRMTTPIYPIMDNVRFFTHFFFTPNRLVWKNWEKFNGAQDNPGDTTDYTANIIHNRINRSSHATECGQTKIKSISRENLIKEDRNN
jgi:hypothetical protein